MTDIQTDTKIFTNIVQTNVNTIVISLVKNDS